MAAGHNVYDTDWVFTRLLDPTEIIAYTYIVEKTVPQVSKHSVGPQSRLLDLANSV